MAVNVNLPDFKTDPLFKKSQDLSYSTGEGILGGKPPEWMAGYGQTGSQEFKDMLALVNRNTATAVNENLVRRNTAGSGVGLSTIAKQTADTSTSLSWADYLKASGEKKGLLDTGLNTISGVRGAGLQYAGQENQFGMQGAQLQLSADQFNENLRMQEQQREDNKKAAKNKMWTDILTAGIGSVGSIIGMGMLGSASKATSGGSSVAGGGAITRATPKQYAWGGGF